MKTILIAAVLAAAGTARADGYKSMARELAADARKAGVSRVAVMPFTAADGGSSRDGWNISEKLVTQLVKTGKVQALERSMLKTLLEEHDLGRTGAFDPATLRKLGKVLSAEGIVTGSFVTIGREVVINARLINVETGVIVAASERRAERDWFDLAIVIPAPEFTVEAPTIITEGELALKDAVAAGPTELSYKDCDTAATTVDRLEAQILDLKARYWARKLKDGLDPRTLKANPGSTISDPELKQEFYDKMKAWFARPVVPPLTPVETKRFVAVDGRAYALAQHCGI
ncbi:MAG: CsgG/HfaB family protein [Elusimicrobiota bacterium]|nr:MAG: CsgG/HfaB family protein [Elusimicrobiota bacterium]